MDTIIQILARELGRGKAHVENVVHLIDEDNITPFIAHYRKELYGVMNDTALRTLADRLQYLRNLDKRREEIKSVIEGQGKLTGELSAAIDAATTLVEAEDLYRPYKQRCRTHATVTHEKGLEPLTELLFAQTTNGPVPEEAAGAFIDPEEGMETAEDALQGVSDTIAKHISNDADIRKRLWELVWKKGSPISAAVAKEPEDTVYRLYCASRFPLNRMQGHQVLAINRGKREGVLKVSVEMERGAALVPIRRAVLNPDAPAMAFVRTAAEDAYDRLTFPSVGREIRSLLTEQADEGAVKMFGLNLRPLLTQPPVKNFTTVSLDPGYRNDCKVAVMDVIGKVLGTAVIYPTFGQREKERVIDTLAKPVRRHGMTHIAIGNGTASRETEQITVGLIEQLGGDVSYMIVDEAGASIYSAPRLAAGELPNYDANSRSAVSIVRRPQDPLAELVKIGPKSIGVGQHQHDMPQTRLDETLSDMVEDCINAVRADFNTTSAPLLFYVAGLNHTAARDIIKYWEENGALTIRKGVLKVPKLGPKAFEQCTGFLRVPESRNVLDHAGIHPESYDAAETLLTLCGYGLSDAKADGLDGLRERVTAYGEEKAAEVCGVGVPTLRNIMGELVKPGRDPRGESPRPILHTDVLEMKDLKPDMKLTGTVCSVIDFDVFMDIGVHQDELMHVSQLREDRWMQYPSEVCAVGDIVTVWVLEVGEKKKRISFTMKKPKG